jgi:hypothetical protein
MLAAAPAVSYAAASDKASSDKPDTEKKICKRETTTGSIMSRRICHTRAEWEAMTAQSKSDLQKVRNIELTHQQVGIQR